MYNVRKRCLTADVVGGSTQTILTGRPRLLRNSIEEELQKEEKIIAHESKGIFCFSGRSIQSEENSSAYLTRILEDLLVIGSTDIKGINGRDSFDLYPRSCKVIYNVEFYCHLLERAGVTETSQTAISSLPTDAKREADIPSWNPPNVLRQNVTHCRPVATDPQVLAGVQNVIKHSASSRRILAEFAPLMSLCEKLSPDSAIDISPAVTLPTCVDSEGRDVLTPRLTCGNVWTKKQRRPWQPSLLPLVSNR